MHLATQKLWTKDFLIISLVNLFLTLIFFLLMVTIGVHAVSAYGASTSEAGFPLVHPLRARARHGVV